MGSASARSGEETERSLEGDAGQVRLSRFIRQPTTDVIDLGRVDATSVGRLLAASGTSDIADAHVVICARRAGQPVVTSDPGDLQQLDPTRRLIPL